jgi:hypothetical protein
MIVVMIFLSEQLYWYRGIWGDMISWFLNDNYNIDERIYKIRIV